MIKKYTYGKPFQTESVVVDIAKRKRTARSRQYRLNSRIFVHIWS